jgi:site-specific DNA-methyltransferase (adenine-specific)
MNHLYYGDNLDILRRYIKDESIDLVYLDPPFNSNRNYNVLFEEKNGTAAAAQIKAFDDTWSWDMSAAAAYQEVVERGENLSVVMQALRAYLGESDMMAYLAMMALRLIELHRVLKNTGSIFLHCDPTSSHYLKMLMDAVFSPKNFGNEIVWQRTNSKGLAFTRFARNHDIILRYTKSEKWTWNQPYTAHDPEYVSHFYRFKDADGRVYRLADLTNPNKDRPNLTYELLGVTRVWRWTKERMMEAVKNGIVVQTKEGGVPQLKRYLDEQEGNPVGDVWTDILPVQAQATEKLGYPTQKPEELLQRIILSGTNENDVILDPFCGCGTAISVAEKIKRQWIGIDITHLAISLMKHRLQDAFGANVEYKVVGEPADLGGAEELAKTDPYQFQWWSLGLCRARPMEQKKGADHGIDGRIYFHDDESGKTKQIIFSVKAGHVQVSHVRDLRGVLEREKAEMGVLICMEAATKPMTAEAAGAGFYASEMGSKHPKIQILTIEELLGGKKVDMPYHNPITFKKAEKHVKKDAEQLSMDV